MPIPARNDIKRQIVDLLRVDGAQKTTQIYMKLSAIWRLTPTELTSKRDGRILYENEIRWARQELVIEGIIDRPSSSGRGTWRLAKTTNIPPGTYDEEDGTFEEGVVKKIEVNTYERNDKARESCLRRKGYSCAICNFNFEKKYGEIGRQCIHVHHLVEISTIGKNYKINPFKDLIPVCPNCHYMIHRRKPAYTPEEIIIMLEKNKPTI